MAATLWDHVRRIVFERGVMFVKDTEWRCVCADRPSLKVPVPAVTKTAGLSPVLVELEHPSPEPVVLLLPDTEGRMLDIELQMHELLPRYSSDGRQLSEFFSVVYTALAAVYHCKRMAEAYAQIVRRFAIGPFDDSERVVFGNNPEPFFEFDALISSAMRTLDTLRRPSWRLYGNSGSLPASFRRTVDNCRSLPETLQNMIEDSWRRFFATAKEYRDCIHHYVAPGADHGFACMQRHDPGFWTMTAWLPDNPEARSAQAFTFNGQLDALTYAWSLTNRVVQITKTICIEVEPRLED
jgi:hypothetical protein